MMIRKPVSGMLAVIALVALSATGAQAGAGGVPSALTSFFLCKSISGAAVGDRFDIQSLDTVTPGGAGWGPTLDNVKIGVATLACSFARVFPPVGDANHIACDPRFPLPTNPPCNEVSPTPVDANQHPIQARDLKCYAISVGRSTGTPATGQTTYTVTDGLFGTDASVNGTGFNYLCAPAKFNQNVQ